MSEFQRAVWTPRTVVGAKLLDDVRSSIARWYRRERDGEGVKGESWELYLISPRLMAEFAAAQIARWW